MRGPENICSFSFLKVAETAWYKKKIVAVCLKRLWEKKCLYHGYTFTYFLLCLLTQWPLWALNLQIKFTLWCLLERWSLLWMSLVWPKAMDDLITSWSHETWMNSSNSFQHAVIHRHLGNEWHMTISSGTVCVPQNLVTKVTLWCVNSLPAFIYAELFSRQVSYICGIH